MNSLEWKSVIDYDGLYEVSNDGLVRSTRTGELLAGWVNSYGYQTVSFVVNGKRATKKVHRLVALAFLPTIDGKNDVNHIDGDKLNNCVDNLEWATRGENTQHAITVLGISREIKPVWQMSLTGELLALHINPSSAARLVDGSQMMIAACCKGTAKTAYDYTWEYATGVNVEKLLKENQLSTIKRKMEQLKSQADELEHELMAKPTSDYRTAPP